MDTQLIHSMDQTNRRHKTDVKKKKNQKFHLFAGDFDTQVFKGSRT